MDLTGDCGLPYAVSICFLVILLFYMTEASDTSNQKRCTQRVKEERVRFVYKKISVTRKIPAQCSGWDRDWSWITKKDCKDRYRVEYLNDKRQVKVTTYRTEHVCCPNEVGSWCNVSVADSRRPGETGYTTETHTLLTILLPVVATLAFIFIISIVIIACVIVRKRRRRAGNGASSGKHSYESVKVVDSKKKGAGKLQQSSKLGEIPYSVEVVDGGPDRSSVTSELLDQGQGDILDLSKPPVPVVDSTDRFQDIDKDTVIDNALLYGILVEGQNRTEPTAPTLDQVVT